VQAVPFTMEVNDMPLSVRYGNEPEAYNRILAHLLHGWRKLGNPPGCLDITVHAHVYGRPSGVLVFKEALQQARACASAWVTHHAALADLYTAVRKQAA
jgi:hypothetical protein